MFTDLYVHMYYVNENYEEESFIYVPNSKPNPIIYQLFVYYYVSIIQRGGRSWCFESVEILYEIFNIMVVKTQKMLYNKTNFHPSSFISSR